MAKGTGTGGDGFARDLGYLDAFFDKLEAHGAAMGGASGDRLRTLIGEERRRWTEIRSLLAGGTAAPSAPSGRTQSDVAPSRNAGAAAGDLRPTLTVGSLRSMRARGRRE